MIICQDCVKTFAHEQRVLFWREPDQAVVEYHCSNCGSDFSRIVHTSEIAQSPSLTQLLYLADNPYDVNRNVNQRWSPYDNRRPSLRGPARRNKFFRGGTTKADPVACNRKKVTAKPEDISHTVTRTVEEDGFSIEEKEQEIK